MPLMRDVGAANRYTHKVQFNSVLLTATGFLVGLALTFRGTTAYERYNEARKYWAQLTVTTQSIARILWVHVKERQGQQGKEDLLAKVFVEFEVYVHC
jgi:ion channel-forming bestrophin family protein